MSPVSLPASSFAGQRPVSQNLRYDPCSRHISFFRKCSLYSLIFNSINLDRFDSGLSAAVIVTKDNASLVTEVTSGLKSSMGDAVGLNIQPTYFLNEYVQIVSRYQIAISDRKKGLSPQSRYEEEVQPRSGDLYQAAYLGMDYYITRHRFKIMHGIEYANMNGRDNWTTTVMLRFFFGPHSGGAFPMNQVLPLEYD